MKTKMPSILTVNYPMLKVDTEFFFLKIPSFSSTCCTNTNKLTNPRLCRVVRNSIQEKGQQFKNQITTFTTL